MKNYIVTTKSGKSFTIEAENLKKAKIVASFNCRHMKEKFENVYLKK